MSLLARIFGPAAQGGDPLDNRYYDTDFGAGAVALTGQRITPTAALSIAAVYRGVSILANTFAGLPIGIYERIKPRGRQEVPDHPLDYTLCRRPNPYQTSFKWRRLLMSNLLLRGNAFNQIGRDDQGRLVLVPLDPDRVAGPEQMASGALRYWFTKDSGQRVPLIGDLDVWHLTGLSIDGLRGLSIIELAKNTMGVASSAEQFAALFFDRGVTFKGVLEHPGRLKPETAADMGANFQAAYGGYKGAHKTPVLWEGMQYKPVSMTSKDAEFMDSRRFGVAEIARWLGLPPHMLGDVERSTSWGTGIEEQRSEMTTFTMLPWVKLFEEDVERVLLLAAEAARYYVRMNLNALLRPKTKERYDVYAIGVDKGILSPNDCRELEELNPREGGDEYKDITAIPSAPSTPPGKPNPPPADSDDAARAIALGQDLRALRDQVGDLQADVLRTVDGEIRARAESLARWVAGEVLRRELEALTVAATKNASDGEKWRHAVGTFYGRHAAYVEAALSVTKEASREYCRRQQLLLSEKGVAALSTWLQDHTEALVALALAASGAAAGTPAAAGTGLTIHNHLPAPIVAIENKAPEQPITVNVPEQPAAAVTVNVAAPPPAPAGGPQEIRIVGSVDTRVKEMPAPPPTVTDVLARDKQGRPTKVKHTPQGS